MAMRRLRRLVVVVVACGGAGGGGGVGVVGVGDWDAPGVALAHVGMWGEVKGRERSRRRDGGR